MKRLERQKTRIVCTIGPASDSVEVIQQLIDAGMDVARLNFSHGDFDSHKQVIENIRTAARRCGRNVAIMADLPGPKMRIGTFEQEPVYLERGQRFTLTSREVLGNSSMVSACFQELFQAVKPGDILFLSDGLIQLRVEEVDGEDIHCTVLVGGELRSRKGLNVPGIRLSSSAFTERDRECLEFALKHGVDAVSQSFVGRASDLEDLRRAAREMGFSPFVIAKIERSSVIDELESVIDVSDGIMVARGDLGVEIPIEKIAIVQKFITRQTQMRGKPVITATQMLQSMTHNRRPTRAEATDVANAILDGTDAVMLSEESAMGQYPVEATEMLAKIAMATEPHIERARFARRNETAGSVPGSKLVDLIAKSLNCIIGSLDVAAIFCPTESGVTARNVTRFRLPYWILAVSNSRRTCNELMFSYGVWPIYHPDKPADWGRVIEEMVVREFGLKGEFVPMIEGPSRARPDVDHKLQLVRLKTST